MKRYVCILVVTSALLSSPSAFAASFPSPVPTVPPSADLRLNALHMAERDESEGADPAKDAFGRVLVEERRAEVIAQAMGVLGQVDASQYGGLYYSDHMWVLNVNVLADHPEVAELLPDEPDIIRLHEVRHSYQALLDFQRQLDGRWEEFGIYYSGVQVAENRVEIGLLQETEEVLGRLRAAFSDTELYTIKQQPRDWREDPKISPYTPDLFAEGVAMRLDKPAYPAGNVVLQIDLSNRSDTNFSHGSQFLLEIEEEGIWYPLPMINAISNLLLYSLPAGEEQRYTCDLDSVYGDIQPGRYRVILDFQEKAFACAELFVMEVKP